MDNTSHLRLRKLTTNQILGAIDATGLIILSYPDHVKILGSICGPDGGRAQDVYVVVAAMSNSEFSGRFTGLFAGVNLNWPMVDLAS